MAKSRLDFLTTKLTNLEDKLNSIKVQLTNCKEKPSSLAVTRSLNTNPR
jgi:hypothetical protein